MAYHEVATDKTDGQTDRQTDGKTGSLTTHRKSWERDREQRKGVYYRNYVLIVGQLQSSSLF